MKITSIGMTGAGGSQFEDLDIDLADASDGRAALSSGA